MRRFLLAFLCFLAGTPAWAGTTIQQSGNVTPGHLTSVVTSGVVQDAGTATQGRVNSLGLYGLGGTPLCITNSATPAPFSGNYTQLCFGVSGSAAYVATNTYNGTHLPLEFIMNGNVVATATDTGFSGGGGGGSGTVTSVGLSLPGIFTVSGSPVTTSGTLTATLANEISNTFFAGPNGASGAPTFRTIAPADLPIATTGAVGAVRPDGSTVTISAGGVLSAATSGGSVVGPGSGTQTDHVPLWSNTLGTGLGFGLPVGTTGNSTLIETSSAGLLAQSILPLATSSAVGGVQVDGTSIKAVGGVISTVAGTVSGSGCVQAASGVLSTTGPCNLSTVSVKQYGAKGDGSTDDTTAIQNAVNSGAGFVLFPAGTYIVSQTITLPSNTTVSGVGRNSTIKSGPTWGTAATSIVGGNNYFANASWTNTVPSSVTDHDIAIENLNFDATVTSYASGALAINGVTWVGATRTSFLNNTYTSTTTVSGAYATSGNGVNIAGGSDHLIQNNAFYTVDCAMSAWFGWNKIKMVNNFGTGSGVGATGELAQLNCTDTAETGAYSCSDAFISNSKFTGVTTNMAIVQINPLNSNSPMSNIKIDNFVFDAGGLGGQGINIASSVSNVTLTNGILQNFTTYPLGLSNSPNGIFIDNIQTIGVSTSTPLLSLASATNVVVTNWQDIGGTYPYFISSNGGVGSFFGNNVAQAASSTKYSIIGGTPPTISDFGVASGTYLPLTGGTLTGNLTLGGTTLYASNGSIVGASGAGFSANSLAIGTVSIVTGAIGTSSAGLIIEPAAGLTLAPTSALTSVTGALTASGAITGSSLKATGITTAGCVTASSAGLLSSTGVACGTAGVTTFNTRSGAVTLTSSDVTTALGYTPFYSGTGSATMAGPLTVTNGITSSTGISATGNVTIYGSNALVFQGDAQIQPTSGFVALNTAYTASTTAATGYFPIKLQGTTYYVKVSTSP